MTIPFKTCPCCNTVWPTRTDFLADQSLEINGYAPDFDNLLEGLFFFTHHVSGCFSTMTLKAKSFSDLYTGKKHKEHKTGDEDCPRLCFEKEELRRCDELCECAYVREIIAVVREHPKGFMAEQVLGPL
jgi:hypothetical protein